MKITISKFQNYALSRVINIGFGLIRFNLILVLHYFQTFDVIFFDIFYKIPVGSKKRRQNKLCLNFKSKR